MNRRGFVRISSVALLPILLGILPKSKRKDNEYTIEVISDRSFGHLLREKATEPPSEKITTDIVIVGGGVAGISAALTLKNQNFLLIEGSDRLGGSSAAGNWKDSEFAMGAHYELAYPSYFGKEVINLLTSINVLAYNPANQMHEFVDKKYVIRKKIQEQCYLNGQQLTNVLSGAKEEDQFYNLLKSFSGKMPLPTRLISNKYSELNKLSFANYLRKHINLNNDLQRRIDYQMLDDWGGTSEMVSALAGIHYYMCRPYDEKDVELLSPPNGNAYLIEKMIGELPHLNQLKTNTFVRSIKENDTEVIVETLAKNGTVKEIKTKGVIYAGQKHTLKYIMPHVNLFAKNQYAPWVVLNLICKKGLAFDKWQNDIITNKIEFLGFVNSTKQYNRSTSKHDVLTVYYCFKPEDRKKLVKIEEDPRSFIENTLTVIETETNQSVSNYLTHATIKLMGHAMPIPIPNYLSLTDTPSLSDRIIFAGVDTGRLPLFSEACDSGIQAAEQLNSFLTTKS